MPTDDVPSAARRVADRFKAAQHAGHTDVALRIDEVIALLPVLDAVAAGAGDEIRRERWASGVRRQWEGSDLPQHLPALQDADNGIGDYALWADVMIALADTERAAAVAEGWRAYEEARDELERAIQVDQAYEMFESSAARITLDAAVRRLAGLDPAA